MRVWYALLCFPAYRLSGNTNEQKRSGVFLVCAQFDQWRIKLSCHNAECRHMMEKLELVIYNKWILVKMLENPEESTLMLGFLIFPKRFWDVSLTVVADGKFEIVLSYFEWCFVLRIILLSICHQLHVACSRVWGFLCISWDTFQLLKLFPLIIVMEDNILNLRILFGESKRCLPAWKETKSAIPFLKFKVICAVTCFQNNPGFLHLGAG